jgi:predicted Na+-dependent transporter
MVCHYVAIAIVPSVVRLDGLVVLVMGLMLMRSLLLKVVEHWHPLVAGCAIETGIVALLVALREHILYDGRLECRVGCSARGCLLYDQVTEE